MRKRNTVSSRSTAIIIIPILYRRVINNPVARPRDIRKAQADAALLLGCLDSLHTAKPHSSPLFLLQLQHNSLVIGPVPQIAPKKHAAHKLARLIYTMLTKGEKYTDQEQGYYEERYRERVLWQLAQRAEKMGMKLVVNEQPT